MFKRMYFFAVLNVFVFSSVSLAFIVDHTYTDLTQIPQSAIEQAKASLHIAYGHTSHGSQLTDGMSALVAFANGGGLGLSLPTDIFAWNNGGSGGALDLHDYAMAGDVGYYPQWVNETIAYLDNPANADVNVIIWSWCGQASGYTEQQMIDYYLAPMSQLEIDYPDITFIYMTGHLDGTGQTGNLYLRNQQIRNYCIANEKVLYDFADIESYDPDGLVNYMTLLCNDNCDYDSDGNGSLDRNWAIEWQNSHTENIDWYQCSVAHSQPLNGNRKAYTAWYLWARLGGWNPTSCAAAPSNLVADCNALTYQVTLNWMDNSGSPQEDSFIIQRQVDGGTWNNNYATVGQNITTFAEILSADGTYSYRIAAYMADNGQGSPCTSSPSNVVSVVRSTTPPAAPSSLGCSLVGGNDIQLTWIDNSDNEQVFVLERSIDGGAFGILSDTIAPNTENYTDQDVPTQHTYSYRVKARNGNGDSGYSNTISQNVPYTTYTMNLQSTTDIDDSFLSASSPVTNYGDDAWAPSNLNNNMRYVVKYNFPTALNGKRILSASINFYWWNQSGTWQPGLYMQLYQLTQDWDEMSVTWNDASTAIPWTTAGGVYDKLVGQAEIGNTDHAYYVPTDVTDIVRRWVRGEVPNYGLIMINNNAFTSNIKASEYNPMSYLSITYTDACLCDYSADFNYDCWVNLRDFSQMAQNWGLTTAEFDIAPAGGDGVIDILDFQEMAGQWLSDCL